MKSVNMHIDDLLEILEAMKDTGTEGVVVCEYEGWPALIDMNNPEAVFVLKMDEETETNDTLH